MQKSKNDLTLDTYNLVAQDYAKQGLNAAPKPEEKKFSKLLKPGQKVLDAGCGFGRNLKTFLEYGLDVYGFDGSEELLKIARVQAPNAKLKLLNFREKLPYADNFFDAVWARNSLHHLELKDLPFALSELKRVLKSNGMIFIEWKTGSRPILTKDKRVHGKERFYNFLPKEDVEKLIEPTGFKITESYTYTSEKKQEHPNFVVIFATKI